MEAHILLVDDDRLLLEVVGEYLEASGYAFDMVESAPLALERFVPGKYKLAILDLMMPEMSGVELMRELLKLDENLFCLIMTGFPTVETTHQAMQEGASDYIIKPFQFPELLNVVQKYV